MVILSAMTMYLMTVVLAIVLQLHCQEDRRVSVQWVTRLMKPVVMVSSSWSVRLSRLLSPVFRYRGEALWPVVRWPQQGLLL